MFHLNELLSVSKMQVRQEATTNLQRLAPFQDNCSLRVTVLLPGGPAEPPCIAVVVSRPRLILLRRFVNNLMYGMALASKEVDAFTAATAAVQVPDTRPSEPAADAGRHGTEQVQRSRVAERATPFGGGRAHAAAAADALAAAAAVAATTTNAAAIAGQLLQPQPQQQQQQRQQQASVPSKHRPPSQAPAAILSVEVHHVQIILPASHTSKALDDNYALADEMVAALRASATAGHRGQAPPRAKHK